MTRLATIGAAWADPAHTMGGASVTALCVADDGRTALDASRACGRCEAMVRRVLRDAPGLYYDLADPRRGKPLGRTPSAERPLPLTDAAKDARSAIRACLVTWVLILTDQPYRCTMPPDTLRAMAHLTGTQAGRLLNSDHADQLIHDLSGIESYWAIAWPSRRSGVCIACPSCGEAVRVDPDADEVACATQDCPEWGTPRWWLERLAPETLDLMTATEASVWLWRTAKIRKDADSIDRWARSGALAVMAYELDGIAGRWYDPVLVMRVALEMSGWAA